MMPLMRLKYRKYPKFVEAVANRHIMYNGTLDHIEKEEREGKVFVIRPESSLPVGRVEKDPEKLKSAYEIGRETAKSKLGELTEYLQK